MLIIFLVCNYVGVLNITVHEKFLWGRSSGLFVTLATLE